MVVQVSPPSPGALHHIGWVERVEDKRTAVLKGWVSTFPISPPAFGM